MGCPAAADRALYAWASVHGAGRSVHTGHTHVDSSLAAVFYARAPPGAGDMVLSDPRSVTARDTTRQGEEYTAEPLPPFHGREFRFTPRTGDLIVFPGWMMHRVAQSAPGMEGWRVSVSFNMLGNWADVVP